MWYLTSPLFLNRESEYAAWTLVNGYALNHTTITVHDFKSSSGLRDMVDHLIGNGVALNGAGGTLINGGTSALLVRNAVPPNLLRIARPPHPGRDSGQKRSLVICMKRRSDRHKSE
jgi:hypothetical protein